MSVKRYDYHLSSYFGEPCVEMEECVIGDYVSYRDYQAVEARLGWAIGRLKQLEGDRDVEKV